MRQLFIIIAIMLLGAANCNAQSGAAARVITEMAIKSQRNAQLRTNLTACTAKSISDYNQRMRNSTRVSSLPLGSSLTAAKVESKALQTLRAQTVVTSQVKIKALEPIKRFDTTFNGTLISAGSLLRSVEAVSDSTATENDIQ